MAGNYTFVVVQSAKDGGLLPKDVYLFGRNIFEVGVGAEQSVWENVGVGEIFGGAIGVKDIENDAGVSCCHRYVMVGGGRGGWKRVRWMNVLVERNNGQR